MRCIDRWLPALIAFLLMTTLSGCGGTPLQHVPATGEVAGKQIDTTVDSPVARYYLEDYLAGDLSRPQLDARIRAVERATAEGEFSRADLQSIAQRFSTDFATLLFARQVTRQPANRRFRRAFERELNRVLNASVQPLAPPAAQDDYALLFAPGWLYRSLDSGADFAAQRALLSDLGYRTYLIRIDEDGGVEANATVIADAIRRFSERGCKIILVSTSKGGPEAAYALGAVLEPGETKRVRAWINVGGLLRGTPLTRAAFDWPKSWLARLYFFYKGWDFAGVESLTTVRSDRRLARINLPDHLLVINTVAAPLSGQVSRYARDNYLSLRDLGPNDGLTLLADELALGGIELVELGLDHYYLDPQLDLKTAALARVVIDLLEGQRRAPHLTTCERRSSGSGA